MECESQHEIEYEIQSRTLTWPLLHRLGGCGGVLRGLLDVLERTVVSPFIRRRFVSFTTKLGGEDRGVLAKLLVDGTVKPVIDRTLPLERAADEVRSLERGHVRGKVVLTT